MLHPIFVAPLVLLQNKSVNMTVGRFWLTTSFQSIRATLTMIQDNRNNETSRYIYPRMTRVNIQTTGSLRPTSSVPLTFPLCYGSGEVVTSQPPDRFPVVNPPGHI